VGAFAPEVINAGVGYFYFIIKGKITLSFASPEKENLYIYNYDVITWKIFLKYSEHNYSRSTLHQLKEVCDRFPPMHLSLTRRPYSVDSAIRSISCPFSSLFVKQALVLARTCTDADLLWRQQAR